MTNQQDEIKVEAIITPNDLSKRKKMSVLDFKNIRYGTEFKTIEEMRDYESRISKTLEYNIMDGVLGCVK